MAELSRYSPIRATYYSVKRSRRDTVPQSRNSSGILHETEKIATLQRLIGQISICVTVDHLDSSVVSSHLFESNIHFAIGAIRSAPFLVLDSKHAYSLKYGTHEVGQQFRCKTHGSFFRGPRTDVFKTFGFQTQLPLRMGWRVCTEDAE